jgi:hypothetical protein
MLKSRATPRARSAPTGRKAAKRPVEKLFTLARASAKHDDETDTWEIVLPRTLRSPNATLWKHWRVKHQERRTWTLLLLSALVEGNVGIHLVERFLQGRRLTTAPPRHVDVVRWVRHRSHFIRDVDNLTFCCKPLYDALVEVGLLRDDAPAWVERGAVDQRIVLPGGPACTVLTLRPLLAPRTP